MKQLKKPTKAKNCRHAKRLDRVCEKVRQVMHMNYWPADYYFHEEDEKERYPVSCSLLQHNKYIRIHLFPAFWELNSSDQLRGLFHEHAHALLSEYNGVVTHLLESLNDYEYRHVENLRRLASEHTADHIAGVLYDLTKDEFRAL